MKTACLTLLVLVFPCLQGLRAATEQELFHVAPTGNDSWSGRLASPNESRTDGPFATLDAARLAVRRLVADGLSSPVSVMVRGGEYPLEKTILFTPEDSGTQQFPITYRAYPNEKPVFTGSRKLTGWKKVTDPPDGVAPAAKDRLWYCEIPSGLRGKWSITSLYDGTRMLKRSRSGELKASSEQVLDPFNTQPKKFRRQDFKGDMAVFTRTFRYNDRDLRDWENLTDIELLLSPRHVWLVNLLPLAEIDATRREAIYGIDSTYGISPENKYFVENAIDYLDEPGEWVFNSKEGRVYLWPEGPLEEADLRAPFLQEFIRVEGVEDGERVGFLNFEGLTFRHGLRDTWQKDDQGIQHDWEMYDKGNALMRFRHAEDCVVRGCTFEASSGTGVRLDLFCQRITVADSIFAHLGGTGILLSGYAPGTKDENRDNTITNNYLHHIGTIYTHSPAIFVAQSGHNLISRNTIHDLGYNGIVISGCRPGFITLSRILRNRREWVTSLRMDEIEAFLGGKVTPDSKLTIEQLEPLFHARENRIVENEIYRVMQQLHDGNGIYFSGMGGGNIADRNFLHDISGDRGYIRLDDHSPPTTITNNVGLRTSMMFVMKGPGEYRNNFAIDCARLTNKRWCETQLDHFVYYLSEPGLGRLKKKKGRKDDGPDGYVFDDFERISNSLLYARGEKGGPSPGEDLVPVARRGDAKVGLLFADPLFDREAFDRKIFRFKEGSPAPELGIQPLDLSMVGSTLAPREAAGEAH
ncbi:right-handed parallel beta-helix repeat-containing protein [Haloferula sp. A504]|uniref:right-handed parallel beta-helix repeat-containing protein n=1 Tax=Haloferula sp. A504 TaxID=3373601 RepID=UPI0031C74411|nr:right-handed parallel beta-helix repeat-containing protein [Verrucomicrobiaceae bacterium E54]